MIRRFVIAAAVALPVLVAACAHDQRPPPVPPPAIVCPPLKTYTADQEKALAVALAALPAGSPLVGAMADYGALRATVRACRSDNVGSPGTGRPSH